MNNNGNPVDTVSMYLEQNFNSSNATLKSIYSSSAPDVPVRILMRYGFR